MAAFPGSARRPYHKRPGVDPIAQGMGGHMLITGAPGEGPMRVGIPSDLSAGLLCANGILDGAFGARGIRPGPVGTDLAS